MRPQSQASFGHPTAKCLGRAGPRSAGWVRRPGTVVPPDTQLGNLYTPPGQFSREDEKQGKLNSAVTQ